MLHSLLKGLHVLLGTDRIDRFSFKLDQYELDASKLSADDFLIRHLFENNKYAGTKRVTQYHRSVFCQNGEDGIIEEIFRRIGVTNRYFVEFGAHGLVNNSTYMVLLGWQGLWIGGDEKALEYLRQRFSEQKERLQIAVRWITKENIEEIFDSCSVPTEPDFLSIDIDGNDYWILKNIVKYRPRVICIEYNATIPPGTRWIMSYKPDHVWDGTNYFGASLKSYELLLASKDYSLVGCDFTGCNAFFVRNDQDLSLFEGPFTAENHYEPPRYYLQKVNGHPSGFGKFEL